MANPLAGRWLLAGIGAGAVAIMAVATDLGGVRTAIQDRFGTETSRQQAAVTNTAPLLDAPAVAEAPPATTPEPEPSTLTDGAEPADEIALQAPDEAPEPVVPRFDLLRAEPDGSLVIAGTGPEDATVEIIAGSHTIAQVQASANGDFAAVLDEPLDPGDYQIVLRSTSPDGLSVTSRETAVVAIPEAGSNDVLALVEEPGEPSRLITTPGPKTPVLTEVPTEEAETTEIATDEPATAETDKSLQAEATEADVDSPATEVETAAGREPAPASDADQTIELAALPQLDATPPVITDAPQAPDPSTIVPNVLRIEAVEIDGTELFVAGAATTGTRVRLYANEMLLGDTIAGDGDRFLVQVRRDLPVGDYIIRADAIDPATGEVLKRAQVPFTRSAGERLAAVAVLPSAELPSGPPPIPFDDIVSPQPAPGTDAPAAEPEAAATTPETETVETTTSDVAPAEPDVASEEPQVAIVSVPQALGVLQGPPPIATDVPVAAGELVPTGESVIIRRGDTLWHISRRVYGQGVKYTTIYLANEDQIADPDRIWPGQIFAVPDEAMDDAEAVHRELRTRN